LSSLLVVAAAIAWAWGCGRAVLRFGQPPVIGELAAGIVLGPSILGALSPALAAALFPPAVTVAIGRLASAAILVFMFLVGLELDLAVLRRHAAGVVRIATFSLLVPFALGSSLALSIYPSLHGETTNRAAFVLFVGTAMSITAMPVLTRMLTDLQLLQTTIGTIAVGCAAIDDVVAWTMLGFVVGLARGEHNITSMVGRAAGYLGLMLVVVRPLLGWLAGLRERRGGRIAWIVALLGVAAASAVATDWVGIHAVFGAFLAGACVPRRPGVLEGLERPLRRVSAVLLPAFFVLIGLKTQLIAVSSGAGWAITLAIVACASAGKLGGSALAARMVGFSRRDALAIGALLNTRGLVALVALDIGRNLGILSPVLFTMFVIMTFVTTLATVPLIGWLGLRHETARL
jgi:Kef-type K+ transport system membrane component KefB